MPRLLFASILCSVLCLSACQAPSPRRQSVSAAESKPAIAPDDHRAAGLEYERLAAEHRSQRDHYRLLAAEAWRDEAELDQVARLLGEIKRKKLAPDENLRFDLLLAEIELSKRQFERASKLLAVDTSNVPDAVRERWLELTARAFEGSQRPIDAARVRLRLIELLTPTEQAEARKELLHYLTTVPAESLHRDLAKLKAEDPLRIWWERALRSVGEMPPRASIVPSEALGTLTPDAEGTLHREGFRPMRKLGVLLPASGDFAVAGKAILDGLMSMHFAGQFAAEVRVYDSGSSDRSAIAAYRQALADGVDAMVGPVERRQVDAVLDAADERLTLLTLNQPDAKSMGTSQSFHFGLMPEEEAAAAAERFIAESAPRIAVFGTNEDWSERAMAAFDAQLQALGGKISGRRMLRESDVDFAEAISSLIGKPGTAPEERLADGVFIALRPSTARLLVPQLRAAGFADQPMLATSHVYSGTPQALADKDLDGLVFLDGPWVNGASAGLPARSDLGRDLDSAEISPRLFAFGLDAYQLLPYLEAMRAKPGRYLDGASGRLLSDAFGRIRRMPLLFRFVGGQVQAANALRLLSEPPTEP